MIFQPFVPHLLVLLHTHFHERLNGFLGLVANRGRDEESAGVRAARQNVSHLAQKREKAPRCKTT